MRCTTTVHVVDRDVALPCENGVPCECGNTTVWINDDGSIRKLTRKLFAEERRTT